jgi:hypothetical protein
LQLHHFPRYWSRLSIMLTFIELEEINQVQVQSLLQGKATVEAAVAYSSAAKASPPELVTSPFGSTPEQALARALQSPAVIVNPYGTVQSNTAPAHSAEVFSPEPNLFPPGIAILLGCVMVYLFFRRALN